MWEAFILQAMLTPLWDSFMDRFRRSKYAYQKIDAELSDRPQWPPIDRQRGPALAVRRSATDEEIALLVSKKQFTSLPIQAVTITAGNVSPSGLVRTTTDHFLRPTPPMRMSCTGHTRHG